jgi:hypothetical protein
VHGCGQIMIEFEERKAFEVMVVNVSNSHYSPVPLRFFCSKLGTLSKSLSMPRLVRRRTVALRLLTPQ